MPIPWTAIEWYCDSHRLNGELRDEMHFFVRGLDREFIRYHEQKAKRNKPAKPPPGRLPPSGKVRRFK